jgi:hypothetical protein
MNRILLLAAVAGFAGVASAQQLVPMPPAPAPMGTPAAAPVQGTVTGNCVGCGAGVGVPATAGYAHHDSRYGWNPLFRKLAFWKRDNACGTSGGGLFSRLRGLCGANAAGAGAGAEFNPYPNGVPGTLVFPNHYYARSPRDFFMMDGR